MARTTGSSLATRHALVVALEGVWGAGKTSAARALADRLTGHGFDAAVLHYGPRTGPIAALGKLLDERPLRDRDGTGGYQAPHHAAVDVLLRLARHAYHHTHHYRAAAAGHDVILIDHGIYATFAYALTVLAEHPPPSGLDHQQWLAILQAVVEPWFLYPDRAFFLDVPWPLARERATARPVSGGEPASTERLLFLPGYDATYRWVCGAVPQVTVVPVGLRGADEVVTDIETDILALLGVPEGPHL